MQSHAHWEIIFWDNASTDGSAAIAHAFGPPLRYFRSTENTPLGAARNEAIARAKGVYVMFLDCDDILLPRALETQVQLLEAHPWALVYGGSIYIDGQGREVGCKIPKARQGHLLAEQLRQYEIGLPAVMIRRQALLESKLGFDPALRTAEDYCLFMQLAAAYEICAFPGILAKYRIHENALTLKTAAFWGPEIEHTLKLIAEKHPNLVDEHPLAFRFAYAKAAYYRARYHVMCRERYAAIKQLRGCLLVDYRYLVLFLILLLPLKAWDAIHEWQSGRSFRP